MAIFRSSVDKEDLKIKDNFDWKKELPEGVKLEDLTEEERKRLLNRYRFSGFTPGSYQEITGFGGMS